MTAQARHTQGPWEVIEVGSTERHIIDSMGEDGMHGPLAIVQHGDQETLECNARLIAAAPALLAALEAIMAQIDPENTSVGLGNILNARAAIAGAK